MGTCWTARKVKKWLNGVFPVEYLIDELSRRGIGRVIVRTLTGDGRRLADALVKRRLVKGNRIGMFLNREFEFTPRAKTNAQRRRRLP